MSFCSDEGDRLGRRAGPLEFVHDDRVVAEVVDARPAELLRHRKGQQPKLPGFGEQRPVQAAGLPLPLLVRRDDGLRYEVA